MKIGLYFGSFNPIHIGHLIIANIMVETTDLERVWFVISPQNPFKKNKNLLHEFDRYDLVEVSVADNYKLKACDIEFHMPKPSYTIDTLTYISEKYPEYKFALIIGEDNLKKFPNWKNHEVILKKYELYVYPRPGAEPSELTNHKNVKNVDAPKLDISATFIRKCIKEGISVRYMVPPEVAQMIEMKKFYQH